MYALDVWAKPRCCKERGDTIIYRLVHAGARPPHDLEVALLRRHQERVDTIIPRLVHAGARPHQHAHNLEVATHTCSGFTLRSI